MDENRESRKREEELRFWEAFRGCAEENRVAPDRSGFYVKWAKEFVNFLPEKRLKDRSGKDIEAFLASLGERKGTTDWQIRETRSGRKSH
jgi:hypothetical protein